MAGLKSVGCLESSPPRLASPNPKPPRGRPQWGPPGASPKLYSVIGAYRPRSLRLLWADSPKTGSAYNMACRAGCDDDKTPERLSQAHKVFCCSSIVARQRAVRLRRTMRRPPSWRVASASSHVALLASSRPIFFVSQLEELSLPRTAASTSPAVSLLR